jgi:hypothetical protein
VAAQMAAFQEGLSSVSNNNKHNNNNNNNNNKYFAGLSKLSLTGASLYISAAQKSMEL